MVLPAGYRQSLVFLLNFLGLLLDVDIALILLALQLILVETIHLLGLPEPFIHQLQPMLVNIVHVVILFFEPILVLVPNLCGLLLMLQVDALNVKLEFVRLAFLVIDLFLQALLLIGVSPLEGFDLVLMALSERDHLFLRMLLPKGLVLPIAHHDGLIDLPVLGLLLLVLGNLCLEQLDLLKQDAPIPPMLLFPDTELFLQPRDFDIHNG